MGDALRGAPIRRAMRMQAIQSAVHREPAGGRDQLGRTLAAWARANPSREALSPAKLFADIAGGFDLALTYDVAALASVHRGDPPVDPIARALVTALRTPGALVRFDGNRLVIVPPTATSLAEHRKQELAAKRNRLVNGPLLPGVDPRKVWYDGTGPLDIGSLVGNASPARRRIVERAAAMVSHRWQATPRNTHHGLLADGVWTDTPDERFITGGFKRSGANVGLPYFWGGFSDPAQFDRAIAAGLPAGHIFPITPTFREDNPFTPLGAGVDCSGFVARAWGLPYKIATGAIQDATSALVRYSDLTPGDVCMKVWQHVMLYVGRKGDKLLFMESTPPRCIGQAFTEAELRTMEMLPRAIKVLK